MTIPIYQVDAFTRKPFSGNPAAVVLLNEQMSDEWMLALAQEMNLSETAFLLPGGGRLPPALVHAETGGQFVRACHPGQRSCTGRAR